MFVELMPLIKTRAVSITVAAVGEGRIRVNVVPQSLERDNKLNEKVGYSHKDKIAAIPASAVAALTAPVSITGTPEEIDAEMAKTLMEFTESHVRLQKTVDQARNEIAEAVKAIEERDKAAKIKAKTTAPAKSDKHLDEKQPEETKPEGLLPLWCASGSPGSGEANGKDDKADSAATTSISGTTQKP